MKQTVKLFKALADETRLRIYLLLSEGELCVCELINILSMEQSRISHGLRILKEASLIDNRREGKWIVYFANSEMNKNRIVRELKQDLRLSTISLRDFTKCKKENIREKCKVK